MATRYKLYKDHPVFGPRKSIQRTTDDGIVSSIPSDPNNTDYQEYLEWAKTNTAEAAD